MTGILYSDWQSSLLLQKVEAIFFKISYSFVICKKFVKRTILRDLFEQEYHSSVNFYTDSKSVHIIKKFVIFMSFFWGGSRGCTHSTHIHTKTD